MTNNKKMLIILSVAIALLIAEVVLSVVCVCEIVTADDGIQNIILSDAYLEMDVGDTALLQAQITGKFTNKVRKWTSSNERVATVNPSSGEITAVASGAATVTFSVGDKVAFCSVYVKEPQTVIPPAEVEVDGITLNAHTIELALNENYTLTADISPENATDKTVTWKSSDTSVAIVDNGVVTAVWSGAALIYATAGGKIAVCTVKVEEDYSEQELRFKTLDVDGNVVTGTVAKDCEVFSFMDEIVAGKDVVYYTVCRDLECTDVIPSKIVRLEVGYNTFYVFARFNDDSGKLYNVTIRRRGLCTVTFDTDGGLAMDPLEVKEGETITLSSPVKAGYVFNFWTLNGEVLWKTLTVTDDVELLANYTAIRYSLTLNSDGCDAELTGGGLYIRNERVTVTAERRLGYEFLGWYNGETKMSDEYSFSFNMPMLAVTLTAKYKIDDRISNLDFSSTATTFTINGFKSDADTSEVIIPEYTTSINEQAFTETISKLTWLATDCQGFSGNDSIVPFNCTIENLYFDKSVTKLNSNIFLRTDIYNTYYNGSIADWCKIEFGANTNPAKAKSWYVNGEPVEDLVIPEGIEEIKDNAFYGSSIKSVTFPRSLRIIGFAAFMSCDNLTIVNWAEGLKTIGWAAFCCPLAGQLVLPDTVERIDGYAFHYAKVTSVVIPVTVKQIDIGVFENNPLEAVYYSGTVEQWNAISISGNNANLNNAILYYYSESEPSLNADKTDYDGNYWRYVDGVVTVWRKEEIQ